jgi:hypothetical protein
MKKILLVLFMFALAMPAFTQQITEEKAKETVKKALAQVLPDYGKVDRDDGYYELEYKLIYNGKLVSEAEKKIKQAPNMKSGQLLLDFEKELKSKIKSATIESTKFDREDNKWEVHLYIPGIKIDEFEVDAATGEILAD